jgi:hypothetical protein
VARAFIEASRTAFDGASVRNLAGHLVHMSDVVGAIESAAPEASGTITYDDTRLPFPDEVDSSSLTGLIGPSSETPLQEGVADTIGRFRRLLGDGLLGAPEDATSTRASFAQARGRGVPPSAA